MQQFVTWFLACLLFGQAAPSHELHALRVAAPAPLAATAPTPPPAGPNDSPPILPFP